MDKREVSEIVMAGQRLESVSLLKLRTGMSDATILNAIKNGMPKPVRVGRNRFFNTEAVDRWFLSQAE